MSNYRKTMAEALREMYPLTEETQLDEAEKRDAGYPDDSVKIGKKHWIIYRDRKYWYGYEVDKKGNQIGDVIIGPKTGGAGNASYKASTKSDLKTMLAQESVDLDERMRMPRQLIDTNKEVMIVKKNKVIVIDKKDQDKYMKQGWELAEEVGLNEGTIDKVKEIASKKQAMKIDGVMVDSFTASAISQIYDKVNDATKKKMEKLPITKLANLAFKMMQKNEFVPEEVELDEGTKQVLAHGGKGKYKVTKDGDKIEIKFGGKVVGTADFDRGADSFFVSMKGEKGQKSFDDAQAMVDYFAKNKITEEVDLDEAKSDFEVKYAKSKGGPIKVTKFVQYDQARKFLHNLKKDGMNGIISKDGKPVKEEVDLDEDILPQLFMGTIAAGLLPVIFMSMREIIRGTPLESSIKKIVDKLKKNKNYKMSDSEKSDVKGFVSKVKKDKPSLLQKVMKKFKEEVDLDENRMSQLHQMIKDKKSAEEIAKEMKLDVKTVKALMSSHHPEEVEESAASDARRAMRRDKDFSRRDSADDDTDATADDVKGASKNIMMQMRKAQSLNGRFDVEFGDGKKVKIPAKMAIAVQSKYNKMRRPAEKEKFQAKIGKSYKDMLSALKEELQPKKESVLDRIDRKIKEKNDG